MRFRNFGSIAPQQRCSLTALCKAAIPGCSIHIIKNDQFSIHQLRPWLKYFSAVIVGPGPGSPHIPGDIGVVKDLWHTPDQDLLPIFGVCLGLQSLGLEFGARLKRLKVVKHGQTSRIHHSESDIFQNVEQIVAVRYHSLHIIPQPNDPLEVLAWSDDGEENGQVVMSIKHTSRPFWAVQYHPESVCTQGGGLQILQNFWSLAQDWCRGTDRQPASIDDTFIQNFTTPWPSLSNSVSNCPSPGVHSIVFTSEQYLPDLAVDVTAEYLGACNDKNTFVLLDSAANPGRFSIIGAILPSTMRLVHYVGDDFLAIYRGAEVTSVSLEKEDVWSWISLFMRQKRISGGRREIPFWGGLLGYLSYELGVQQLQVSQKSDRKPRNRRQPDVNLVFVERSIVFDSATGRVYVQSIVPDDQCWVNEATAQLEQLASSVVDSDCAQPSFLQNGMPARSTVSIPEKTKYMNRINQAKEYLFAGDSYELCLTARTHIITPKLTTPSDPHTSSSWLRYKALRKSNPAPHSAYFRLHPTTFLSSSPERFLSFSRPPGSICQLRPIKGTVKKSPEITREVAERLLAGSTKEVAENLMIVDLIRHDLHGVVGEDVRVKQFCKVEEYETVWQLVSVIEGRLPKEMDHDMANYSELGWELLRRSLPPGKLSNHIHLIFAVTQFG